MKSNILSFSSERFRSFITTPTLSTLSKIDDTISSTASMERRDDLDFSLMIKHTSFEKINSNESSGSKRKITFSEPLEEPNRESKESNKDQNETNKESNESNKEAKEQTTTADVTTTKPKPARKGGKGALQRASTFNMGSMEKSEQLVDPLYSPRARPKLVAEDEKKIKEEITKTTRLIEILEMVCSYADKPGELQGKIKEEQCNNSY